MKSPAAVCGVLVMTTACAASAGSLVTPDEMARRDAWVRASFEKLAPDAPPSGLMVLANNDAVIKNNRGGKPLTIAGTPYTRGLFCHAVSKVVVRLPSPGKTFAAVAGVDSNEQTSGGRGSVVFSVSVDGETAPLPPIGFPRRPR